MLVARLHTEVGKSAVPLLALLHRAHTIHMEANQGIRHVAQLCQNPSYAVTLPASLEEKA